MATENIEKVLEFTTTMSNLRKKGDVVCFVPHLRSNGTVGDEKFAIALKDRLNQPEEIAQMLYSAYNNVLEDFLAAGMRIETKKFSISPTIKGRFLDATDRFDKKRHSIGLSFNAKGALKTAIESFKVVNATPHVKVVIARIRCEGTDLPDVILPGRTVYITGEGLTLVAGRPDEKVVLLDKQTDQFVAEATVAASDVGEITCTFPGEGAISQGDYILCVTSRNGGAETLTPFTVERAVTVPAENAAK